MQLVITRTSVAITCSVFQQSTTETDQSHWFSTNTRKNTKIEGKPTIMYSILLRSSAFPFSWKMNKLLKSTFKIHGSAVS